MLRRRVADLQPDKRTSRLRLLAVMLTGGMSVAGWAEPSIEDFARAPAIALAELSPDGRWLSYVEQSAGRQRVMLRKLAGGEVSSSLERNPARERIRWCGWDSNTLLVCGTVVPRVSTHRAYEETRLYVIDALAGRVREVNRSLSGPMRDEVIDLTPARAGSVLLQHRADGRDYPEVAELDLDSALLRGIVPAQPPVTRWMSDGRNRVRLGIAYERGEAGLRHRVDDASEWRKLASFGAMDIDAIGPLAFSADGAELYALTAVDGRIALVAVPFDRTRRQRLLFSHPVYDVTGPLLMHPQSGALLGVRYVGAQETTHYFDSEAARIQQLIDEQLPGRINLRIGRTQDAAFELIDSSSSTDPPSWYLLEVQARSISLIGHQYPALEGRDLAPAQAIVYRARDGQAIPAFLTLPRIRGPQQPPAIVLPHGGPETRDRLRFDPLVQFLAARGYVVLQMNFRGSSGYGLRFAAAGAAQWGGVIHNDITDGARWLIAQQIADPARICIAGSSFGGFAALLAAVKEAQWYACSASYAGISDLLALARANERLQYAAIWRERLGIDDRALWDSSPLAHARRTKMPVMLMHGTSDAVVPVRQSRRMARELRENDGKVAFVERADCDHDMTVESCRIEFFKRLQEFLSEAIGSASPGTIRK